MSSFSAAEVAALTELDERRVRKEVEHGIVRAATPPRFDLTELVYFRTLALLSFELGVDDRKMLHKRLRATIANADKASRLALGSIVELKVGEVIDGLKGQIGRFEAWKAKLVVDENILGGEPVFPKSRLAVRHVGGMLLKGVPPSEVKEDYPYLDDADLELAKLFTRAYPRVGRPREAASR